MSLRELGEKIPVSIPTAIPLEEQITQVDARKNVDAVVMNLRTLWRNFSGAYKKDAPKDMKEMIPSFVQETKQVRDLVQSDGLIAGIYLPDYSSIQRMNTGMVFKTNDMLTDKQKLERANEDMAMRLCAKELNAFNIRVQLPRIEKRTWMMTHTAIDLLNRDRFLDLRLLESHTGKIKGPADWVTKITNNEDYMRIPFNLLSLTVFGDRHFLKGYPVRYRKVLKEIAERNNWTPMTTKMKIISNLERYEDDPVIAKEMIGMLQSTIS